MAKKFYTIMIVPHATAKTERLRTVRGEWTGSPTSVTPPDPAEETPDA